MKWFLLFFFLFPFLLSAQDRTVDSLKLALKNAKHDTTRIILLSELSELCDLDEISFYTEPCIKLCEKGAASSSSKFLILFYLKHMSGALNNLGYLAQQKGDTHEAIEYYEKSLKIQEKVKDKYGIALSLNNIGVIYMNQGDIPRALEFYHKSLKLREEIKDKKGIAYTLNNFGFIYDNQGDLTKALEYYQKSLEIQEEIKDKNGTAYSLINIGYIYNCQNDIPKALEYYYKSLKILGEINDKMGKAYSLSNIGSVFSKQGNIHKALEFYDMSLKIYEEIKDKQGVANALNSIAFEMLKQGQLSEAQKFATRSLLTSKELGFPENIRNAAKTLKKTYKKQNKHKEAFEMYELEIQMRDSINNQETKKASIKKQFQYQYEKRAAADSVKNAEEQKVKNAQLTAQHAQLKHEKTQRFALYGGLVLVVAFLGFVYNRFRITQKQKVIIEEQKHLVDEAFLKLEEKNKEVMDSIHYAKRIQTALLPNEKYIDRKLNELN